MDNVLARANRLEMLKSLHMSQVNDFMLSSPNSFTMQVYVESHETPLHTMSSITVYADVWVLSHISTLKTLL